MLPTKEFLRMIKPFDLLSDSEIDEIASKMDVEAYEEGEIIFSGKPKKLYVVFSGNVGLYSNGELVEEFERGDIFGLGVYENAKAIANSDAVCLTIKHEVIKKVSATNKDFKLFFDKILEKDLKGLISLIEGERVGEVLMKKIGDYVTKKPVFCDPYTTIRDAVVRMELNGVGSIVVVRSDMSPVGILTNRDIRKFVIHGESKDEKVSAYMS
ncbi:MAG: CBS domain-containing protein, partial [Archaeoglobaceae archaeon]